jgi:malate permease and related proteins
MAFYIVLNQVTTLFLLIAAGFYLTKISAIGERGVKEMTNLLFMVVTPCIIITSFQLDYTPDRVNKLLIALFASIGIHLFSIIAGELVFRKRFFKNTDQSTVVRFSTVYSNAGFMGLPLLDAVLGQEGLFMGSVYIAVFNAFTWTHGVMLYTGKTDRKSLIKAVLNPNVGAIFFGLAFFLLSIKIPSPVYNSMHFVSNLNTPLAMIIIGNRIAQIDLRVIFSGMALWPAIFARNIAMPVSLLFALHFAGVEGHTLLGCILPVACPTAGSTVLIAGMYGADSIFGARLMTISTLFSIVSIPLVVYLYTVLGY